MFCYCLVGVAVIFDGGVASVAWFLSLPLCTSAATLTQLFLWWCSCSCCRCRGRDAVVVGLAELLRWPLCKHICCCSCFCLWCCCSNNGVGVRVRWWWCCGRRCSGVQYKAHGFHPNGLRKCYENLRSDYSLEICMIIGNAMYYQAFPGGSADARAFLL